MIRARRSSAASKAAVRRTTAAGGRASPLGRSAERGSGGSLEREAEALLEPLEVAAVEHADDHAAVAQLADLAVLPVREPLAHRRALDVHVGFGEVKVGRECLEDVS